MKRPGILFTLLAIATMALFTSCNKISGPSTRPIFNNAVYVVNEGPFEDQASGSVDIYYRELNEGEQDIFLLRNGEELGTIVQSMTVEGSRGFIVVHKENKVVVVDLRNFKTLHVIEDVPLPRYLEFAAPATAYLSCWDNTVKVIDMLDYQVTGSIPVGNGPDRMLYHAGSLFVLNSGGFETDSTLMVIDTDDNTVVAEVVVGDRPSGLALDRHDDLWVMCSGAGWDGFPAAGDTPGQLVQFDIHTGEIDAIFTFPTDEIHPQRLVTNTIADRLYYLYDGDIYRYVIGTTSLEEEPFYNAGGNLYALDFDPKGSKIYASDAGDFIQPGSVHVIRENKVVHDIFDAGIIPGNFAFTE